MNGSPLQARGGQAAFRVLAELGSGHPGTGTVGNLASSCYRGQEQRPTGVFAMRCQFCISHQGEGVRLGFSSQMFLVCHPQRLQSTGPQAASCLLLQPNRYRI